MKYSFKKSFMFVLTILALTFSAVGVTPAYAATLIVTNTTDSAAGSLRTAIASAGIGDTITFDASLSGGTIYLASTLTLTQDVTIDGSALISKITISGDTDNDGTGNVRAFLVNSGVIATLDSLIITKGTTDFGGYGGGINNGGTLTVANSTLSDSFTSYGSGIYNGGTLTITNSTLSGNYATFRGGGIYNDSTLTITNSSFSGNSTFYSGGGIYNDGTLTVINGTLSGNSAYLGGGGIYNLSGTLTVTNSTLSGNSADFGGGIFNYDMLSVTNSTFSGNSATSSGGGIYNQDGTLTVTNSTLSSNSSFGGGGGIANYGGFTNNGGTLNVANSTFSGNSAGFGGGIANGSSSNSVGNILTVTNSTFSGNSASGGGGIFNYDTLTATNSTFSGNSAVASGGGIYNASGTLNYANTIIANSSSGRDCENNTTIGTNNNNLVEDGTCSPALSGDPNLGVLASNDGPTQTFALLTGSSAIDAGNNTICEAAPVNNLDQRGVLRPYGAACDIGSYELDPTAKDITAFSFTSPAATGVITGTDIAVTVPFGTNPNGLVATFTTTGASVAVGVTTQVSGTTANNFTSPVTYTVTAADASTKDYIVTVTVAANPAKDITAFSFTSPAATGVITGTNIAVTVPFGTNLTALVATFTTTGASVAVGVTPQVSRTTANNFTSPVTYTVTAADATTKDYIVTVTVAPATVYTLFLPLILR